MNRNDWLVFIVCLCVPLIAGVFLGAVCGWEAGRRCGRNEVLKQAVESGYVEQVTTVNGDRGYRWKH